MLFGAYALVDGVFGIIGAVTRRRGEPRWVALLISGILGALAVLLWIGVFAVVFGIVLTALAFKLQGWNRDVASRSAATV